MAIATEQATILTRRGLKKDFDPDQMTAGEWAVSIDAIKENQIVWMCFAPGVVKRMGTWDDFQNAIQDISDDIADVYIQAFNEIKASMEVLKAQTEAYKNTASQKADVATAKAGEASQSANAAAGSAGVASTKADAASNSADDAQDYSTEAESYAHGGTGTRPGEDADNAKKYYEQARDISQSLTGALKPKGTVTFANLPSLSSAEIGGMYNISDSFTTTANFKEGAGHTIPAGANVYRTADGFWDILAGTPVTGVKGAKESTYRDGLVNITPENIGALSTDGGTVNGETVINNITSKKFTVEDRNGRIKWLIMFDVTNWYNSHGTTTIINPVYFLGQLSMTRGIGHIGNSRAVEIDVGCSYRRENITIKDNKNSCRLRTTNSDVAPTIIKNTENNKYFLALAIKGADAYCTLVGKIGGIYIGNVLYADNAGSDLIACVPSGYEIVSANYIFSDTASTTRATDTHALLGTAGAGSTVQALIDEIADRVIDKLLPRDGSKAMTGKLIANYGVETIDSGTGWYARMNGFELDSFSAVLRDIINEPSKNYLSLYCNSNELRMTGKKNGSGMGNRKILDDTDILNTLTSTATDKPLSANMGRELNEKLDGSLFNNPIEILSNTDLNDVRRLRIYYTAGNGTVGTLQNCPTDVSFCMMVYRCANGGYVVQEITDIYARKFIRRYDPYASIAWGEWSMLAVKSYVDSFLQTQIIVNTEQLIVCKSGNILTAYLNGLQNAHESTLGLEEKYRPSYAARSIMMENDSGHPVVAYFNVAKIFLAYDKINNSFIPASDRLYGQITWMI